MLIVLSISVESAPVLLTDVTMLLLSGQVPQQPSDSMVLHTSLLLMIFPLISTKHTLASQKQVVKDIIMFGSLQEVQAFSHQALQLTITNLRFTVVT